MSHICWLCDDLMLFSVWSYAEYLRVSGCKDITAEMISQLINRQKMNQHFFDHLGCIMQLSRISLPLNIWKKKEVSLAGKIF